MIFSKHNGFSPDGRRLCHKGGDGGAKEMQRQERERQDRINAAVKAINDIFDPPDYKQGIDAASEFDPNKTYYNKDGSVFDGKRSVSSDDWYATNGENDSSNVNGGSSISWDMDKINKAIANGELYTGVENVKADNKREKLYDEQRQAVYDINARDLNRQYGDAEKANRFGLARNGLMGGSADVDSNARLQEMTNEGLVKVGGIADTASANLKVADESARQSLISMAQSGIDTSAVSQMALKQLESTSAKASGDRSGASIGNLFSNMNQAYLRGINSQNTNQNTLYNNTNGAGNSVRKTYDGNS